MTAPLYETVIEGGKHWSFTARRGTLLRLIDVEGGANVGMLFYNPENPLERYNAPDTLKCQQTFRLTRGHCLYSDMGRIFCSIVADTVGWHDTIAGNANKATVAERWGMPDISGLPQRLDAERPRRISGRGRQIRPRPPRSRRQRELVQQGRAGRGRRPPLRQRQFAGGLVSRSAVRDGYAGLVAYLPASHASRRLLPAQADKIAMAQSRACRCRR